VAALAIANVIVSGRMRRAGAFRGPVQIGAGVFFDMIAIAIVLGASGGAANPFSALLFVYVALAASLLPSRITYLLAAFSALTFGALFLVPDDPACPACAAHEGGGFSSHLYGMWLAYALGATLVVFFMTRVRQALEAQAAVVARLEKRAEEAAKLEAVGTLAAGAAHELGTPLGTIAVLAGELAESPAPDVKAQGAAISAQIARCREVLRRMQPGAQKSAPIGEIRLGETVRTAVDAWRAAHPDTAVVVERADDVAVRLPAADVEAALTVLLDNALHATEEARSEEPIVVEATLSPDGPCMRVSDRGTGVSPELLGRVGEPFLTTKAPGEGMGLGLYVVRTFLQQCGGRLEITDNAPRGTHVAVFLGAGAPT
jgi:two-component system sensor histidine kinase RegB